MFMIGTYFIPRDDPFGVVSLIAATVVGANLLALVRNPDRMSHRLKRFVAIATALMLPAALLVMCLPVETAHTDGIDRTQAWISVLILISGAFGAGLGLMRSSTRWLIAEGVAVSMLAGAAIAWFVVFGVHKVMGLNASLVSGPGLLSVFLVVITFIFRLIGVIGRVIGSSTSR
jgi:hypothetical protein